ncbi:MAG: DUF937 domain-containing protein [Microcella sp.]|nr:DUF937 domain-containing protein [Microcella sp.]
MNDLSGLINLIPIGDIAKKLGVDESVARAAVAVAVPAIVGGLAANAKDDKGAQSLEKALGHHKGRAPKKLEEIDEEDGEKIVSHVFGAKKNDVAKAAAAKAEVNAASKAGGPDIGAIVAQVLPIIAPIVLAFVANQFMGGKTEAAPEPAAAPASGGNPLADMLGGLISSPQGQEMISGALSGLLGGGRR